MEEDIQNYSPTVMFCGTPCTYRRNRSLLVRLMSDVQYILYYKLRILPDQIGQIKISGCKFKRTVKHKKIRAEEKLHKTP